jgi:hypothetical protein
MSRGVKVHDAITEWDGYALFDKDNVLACDRLFGKLDEAEPMKNHLIGFGESDLISIWNVVLTKKGKVNDNSTEQIQPSI